MTTQTIPLLTHVLPQGDHWFLWHDGQRVPLAAASSQELLLKGEVESFVWWMANNLAASIRGLAPQDLLNDYATDFQLQLSPTCTATQSVANADEPRLNHFELELRVTQRVARRLYESLGLQMPAPVAAPQVAVVSSTPALDAAVASAFADDDTGQQRPPLDPFGSFEQRFRFWLASAGIQGEDADKVCAERYIAGCLRDEDSGDLVRDLPSALYRIGDAGREAQKLLNDPREMLRLMTFLRQD